jgi:hypothetical protein
MKKKNLTSAKLRKRSIIGKEKLTAKRDGVEEESMLFLGANPLVLALLAGLAAGKTGVTGALPRRSPQAFSYDVSVKEKIR